MCCVQGLLADRPDPAIHLQPQCAQSPLPTHATLTICLTHLISVAYPSQLCCCTLLFCSDAESHAPSSRKLQIGCIGPGLLPFDCVCISFNHWQYYGLLRLAAAASPICTCQLVIRPSTAITMLALCIQHYTLVLEMPRPEIGFQGPRAMFGCNFGR